MHDSILNRYLFRAEDPARSRKISTSDLHYEGMEPRSMMCASPALMDSSPMIGPVVSEHYDVAPMDGTISRIVNGTVTTQYPSVGMIGDNTGFFCSGTLISPRYVLTAAHCAEGVSATAGRFKLGSQIYSTTQVFVHPGYNSNLIGNDNANDIAIYKLDRDVVGITPSSIFRATPAVGQLLTLVGFGAGGTGNSGHDGTFGTKRVGTTPIDQVSSKLIYWNFDNNSESNTAPGDSGGPAFVNINGTYFVAGVTSGGDQEDAGIGDRSFDTRVDAYAAWIDSIVGTSTSTPIVSISAIDNVAAETTVGQTANPASFTISRTGSTASSLTVTLTTGGTASNGIDYTAVPTKVTIPAGATSTTLFLTPNDDTQSEGTETAIVSLVAGTGYQVNSTNGSATMSILDNDVALWNNNFANRFNLSGGLATATGTNVNATKESGEPNVLNVSGGKSVWWKWTAPVSGTVTISTAGSSFDTTLGVYTGTSVNALSLVRANDDQNLAAGVYTSRVSFSAIAGRQYQILVDGYDGESGSVKLTIDQPTGRKAIPPKSPAWDYRWTNSSAWPNLHRNDTGVWDLRSTATPDFANSRFVNNAVPSRFGSGLREFGFANRWRDSTAAHSVSNTIDEAFAEHRSHELWDVFDEVA